MAGDNQEQQRLQALLRFAVNAGSHGSEPVSSGDALERNFNSEDRAWLREAMTGYAAGSGIDPIDCIKERLRTIFKYLNKPDNEDTQSSSITVEDVYEALEEISDNCDNYDLAADLHKIGGFDVLIQSLRSQDPEIVWRACEVVAVVTQNHQYCQDAFVEMKGLPVLLKLVDDISKENKVREKAFYAFSCLVRGNDKALGEMDQNDGFSVLIRAMQSDVPKLRIKSVFFIKSLCETNEKYTSLFHERGIEQQIVGMLKNQKYDSSSESLNITENLLGSLYTLVQVNEDAREECRNPEYELSSTLRELKKGFLFQGEGYEECINFCNLIATTCFTEENGGEMDR